MYLNQDLIVPLFSPLKIPSLFQLFIMDKDGIISSDLPDVELQSSNIWSYLYPRFRDYNDLTAFFSTTSERCYTYREMIDSSLRFAKELEKYVGYDSGEAVTVIMPNNIDYPIVELGAFAVGASISLIRSDFQPDIALDILKDVKPKVLVIENTYVERFKVIFNQLPIVKIFVRGSIKDFPEGEDLHSVLYSNKEGLDVEKALKIDPETLAVVTCSSGTTGIPKSILITHKTIINSLIITTCKEINTMRRAEDGFQDTVLANLPYAHIASIHCYTLGATLYGCKIFNLTASENLETLIEIIHKYQIRTTTFRAYMVDDLAKMEGLKEKLSSVDAMHSIGMPLNPASAEKLKKKAEKDIFITDGYGASEVGPITYYPKNNESFGSTGKLIRNLKAKIVDVVNGKTIMNPFEQGELYIKTPLIMKGYCNNPKATKEAFDGDWYRTGDVCYFDKNYNFYVIERFKDLISFRDTKIFPSDIENIIKKHDAVIDVGVTGVPDPISREEIPKAFVQTNRPVSEEEIIEFVKKNTSKEELFLCLKVTFVDSLPRNHLGKMVRKVLREMDWAKMKAV